MKKILLTCLLSLPLHALAVDLPQTDIKSELNLLDNYDSNFFIDLNDEEIQKEFEYTASFLKSHNFQITPHHLFIIVDRGPKQLLMVVYPETESDWTLVKASHVSTGKPGRKEHFKTPTGIYIYDGDILGYRALGTFNENHIRGIGLKGSRVWDFGWQTTEDWRSHTNTMKIRMEMHATDPANLEHRLGRPDSEGCIRIPSGMNKFLDTFGVLDEKTNSLALSGDRRWSSLLGPSHKYLSIAGSDFIIIDSNEDN